MLPLLRLEKISFYYDIQRTLLKNIDFSIYAGEKIGLIGCNGCGKTSLLHIILGLLIPQQGTFTAFGKLCRQEADFITVRTKIGLLFQDADDQLFCPTVAEDIAFGPLNLGKSQQEVETIVRNTLSLLNLSDYEHRITYRLSGGEKRLVSLATVLAMQPEILLLDEPTSGLDETAYSRLINILQTLPQAMLIVSHDRNFLQQVVNRVWQLREGKLYSV